MPGPSKGSPSGPGQGEKMLELGHGRDGGGRKGHPLSFTHSNLTAGARVLGMGILGNVEGSPVS